MFQRELHVMRLAASRFVVPVYGACKLATGIHSPALQMSNVLRAAY